MQQPFVATKRFLWRVVRLAQFTGKNVTGTCRNGINSDEYLTVPLPLQAFRPAS
jgi:hypothetical protein